MQAVDSGAMGALTIRKAAESDMSRIVELVAGDPGSDFRVIETRTDAEYERTPASRGASLWSKASNSHIFVVA